jgi:hypothetical protein
LENFCWADLRSVSQTKQDSGKPAEK